MGITFSTKLIQTNQSMIFGSTFLSTFFKYTRTVRVDKKEKV